MTKFNFRFNEKTFNRELNKMFSSPDDIKSYFISFRKHYDKFNELMTPKSSTRMKGKDVKDYSKYHNYSVLLEDHYGMILVIGKNGFDIWLNDLMK